jgi:hypothetical protein
VKTLRQALTEALAEYTTNLDEVALIEAIASRALRQWLEAEGLVVVPRDATQEMTGAVLDACAPRLEIMKTYAAMIAAAPDVLGKP